MKKLIILFIIPVFFGFKTRDEIDEKKMNRDLEIAKNILVTLINSGTDSFFGSASIDANYIKDYGVVFSIPEHLVYFHSSGFAIPEMPPFPEVDLHYNFDEDFKIEFDAQESAEEFERQKDLVKKQKNEVEKQQKKMQKQAEEMDAAREEMAIAREQAKKARGVYVTSGQTSEIDWEDVMITFMTDYADLIGQLQPNERIVVKQKSPYNEMVFVWSGNASDERVEQAKSNISAEVIRKDVSAYKAGKINKNEFVSRIEIKRSEPQKKVADLEMFANIIDRYYSPDLTETFYSQGKPSYEVLEGFGAVFHIKATSGNVRYYARARTRSSGGNTYTVKPEKDKTDAEELYPKFKEDIKAFMLDYGRTIRSLADNDKVMLDIKINSCRECRIPATLEVSTKMSLLKQYDLQKISREKAMNQIEIKEIF